MKLATLEGWAVSVPRVDVDPYLAAALWLIEHNDGGLIVDSSEGQDSLHARVLLETVPMVDLRPRASHASSTGLGIVLVTPSAETLECVDRAAFSASTEWMLLPSAPSTPERAFQDAWLWARQRPATVTRAGTIMPDYDLSSLLTRHEVWALAVRSELAREQVLALRNTALAAQLGR